MHRRILPVAIVGLTLVLAGCGSGDAESEPTPTLTTEESADPSPTPTPPETVEAVGGVGLSIFLLPGDEEECIARAGYSQIREGAQVEILDSAGTVVAVGALGAPKTSEIAGDPETMQIMNCAWTFILDAPAGGGFYRARVHEWESDLVPEGAMGSTDGILMILPDHD